MSLNGETGETRCVVAAGEFLDPARRVASRHNDRASALRLADEPDDLQLGAGDRIVFLAIEALHLLGRVARNSRNVFGMLRNSITGFRIRTSASRSQATTTGAEIAGSPIDPETSIPQWATISVKRGVRPGAGMRPHGVRVKRLAT